MGDIFRKYQATHRWITFRFDLGKLAWTDFVRIGETMSKCEQLAEMPLLPAVRDELHKVYLVRGVLATTAIEGNTMNEAEVRRRVDGVRDLPPSREYQGVAVDNIVALCNDVLADVANGNPPELTPELIGEFNQRVLHGQDLDEGVVPGRVRQTDVLVGAYRGAPAEDCEHLLGELCDWLNRSWMPAGTEASAELRHTILLLKAVLAHLYLAWIHPFGDGNGRTARLVEYLLLIGSGVPSPAAHLLSNHYNLTRDRYYGQLNKASKTRDGEVSFVKYALEGFRDGVGEQTKVVGDSYLRVTWVNYVHERFAAKRMTETQHRRREIVLTMDLSQDPDRAVSKQGIPELSPAIARRYARIGPKAVSRDVNALIADGLLRRVRDGYVPDLRRLNAFLPVPAAARSRTSR